MYGKLLSIDEVTHTINHYSFDGYKLTTSNSTILVLIDSHHQCCEYFGYICTDDNPNQFIGKTLTEIRTTDTDLRNEIIKELDLIDHMTGIQFVTFIFADGAQFQLAVFNEHNGYYGHDIKVIINDKTILDGCL